MVGNILPILLIEIPRNPELKSLLEIPWANITRVTNILKHYQVQNGLKQEPLLHSISALLGPLMVSHLIDQTDLDPPIPPFEAQVYVDNFLLGRMAQSAKNAN